ncbi:Acetaldehyde dehydrogenase, partial [Bienertia sinuspersici]
MSSLQLGSGGTTICRARSLKLWVAPPWVPNNGHIGLGAIARDHEEKVIFEPLGDKAYLPPPVVEAKALCLGVTLGILLQRLTKGATHLTDLDAILEDVLSMCTCFFQFSLVPCLSRCNFVAHHLANFFPFGDEHIWHNHAPKEWKLMYSW